MTDMIGLGVNAFDYMVLGRMIYYFIPSRSLLYIPASTIAAMFVGLDFVSFIVQLVGGSMAGPTSSPADQMKAIRVYMGGIGLQQLFIVAFVSLAARFHLEMAKAGQHVPTNGHGRKGWKGLLVTLYVSLGLITVSQLPLLSNSELGHSSRVLTTPEIDSHSIPVDPILCRTRHVESACEQGGLLLSPRSRAHAVSINVVYHPASGIGVGRAGFRIAWLVENHSVVLRTEDRQEGRVYRA
jgi:hypothetical protein